MNPYQLFQQTQRQRVSDGAIMPILGPILDRANSQSTLVLVWPQLGDFDTLEYAWWINNSREMLNDLQIQVRSIGIGDRNAGKAFCHYTPFPGTDFFLIQRLSFNASSISILVFKPSSPVSLPNKIAG